MSFFSDNFILECCFKIFLSALLGIVLGIERRNHFNAIGIRTLLLITSSCALLGILSYYGAKHPSAASGDPTRIAAGVVTGIGFIGGGVIMRQGFNVKGITTAAIIWTAMTLGLGIGYGLYIPSITLFCLELVALPAFKIIETKFFPASKTKTINLVYSEDNADFEGVKKVLASCGIILRDMNYSKDFDTKSINFEIMANFPQSIDFGALETELKKTGKLLKLSLQ